MPASAGASGASSGTRPVYTFGPLIHNNAVIERLTQHGIRVIPPDANDAALARLAPDALIIIRAHGVQPHATARLQQAGFALVNGTCPHVEKIQHLIAAAHQAGRTVFILGDAAHAEVIGLLGFCDTRGHVVHTAAADLPNLPPATPITVVAQSTLDATTFTTLVGAITARFTNVIVEDTRCHATSRTQAEARALCARVAAMVIIGDRHSANTNRLEQICRECGARTFHVEHADDLQPGDFTGCAAVGVTAGSSTPDWLIAAVITRLESFT
ncbi:MAG: 4-hydroxy-3-methylbut-2-enyl diphosphate reductase [bacterium]|nr:4-hydroxy-3-methylbut-2-enyl diphosphate reductase [bacterium]